MKSEKEVKNFYDEEAKYENSILETKQLVEKVLKYDVENLSKKISNIDENNLYKDFVDLLIAITGRKTNSFYYCQNNDDVKYYGLEYGNVYKTSDLNPEIQSRMINKEVLNLKARTMLAPSLAMLTKSLKTLFNLNYQKGDGVMSTIDDTIIINKDLDFLDNLIKYCEIISDDTGRLHVLVAERDIFALENAKEEYAKKSSVEKWFHKAFNRESTVIENMAKKR